jgi:parvulin-like peptidyl-prolyl isomerase
MKPEELTDFIKQHQDHFSGENKNVSHILVMTADPVTGMAGSPEKEAEAKQKIEMIRAKVDEGLDFGWVAEHYSEDAMSAKGKGVLTTPIKKIGGGLDKEFQKAAWRLKQGEISPPVKSKYGWHVIKCDKVTAGQRGTADFESPAYKEWIVDEFDTVRMNDWLSDIRSKSKVEIAPDAELFKLKELKVGGAKPK